MYLLGSNAPALLIDVNKARCWGWAQTHSIFLCLNLATCSSALTKAHLREQKMMDLFNHPITGLSRDGRRSVIGSHTQSASPPPGRGFSHQALQKAVLIDRARRGSTPHRHDCMVPFRYHMPPWLAQQSCRKENTTVYHRAYITEQNHYKKTWKQFKHLNKCTVHLGIHRI